MAVINDGYLTLCHVKKMSHLKMLLLFPSVIFAKHTKLKEVSFINCKKVEFEFEGHRNINLDGNIFSLESPIVFEIMESAIRIFI